jgi:ABC-type transport system substrate-binding protein
MAAITSSVVRYPYDPQQAAQMLEVLGFRKGADGMLRDAAGGRLEIEPRTTDGDLLRQKVLLSVSDSWQRLGVAAEPFTVPRQRAQDQEYRSTFPAFEIVRQPNSQSSLVSLHSRAARVPANNFVGVGGTNYARYMNAELDTLLDRFVVTIEATQRIGVLSQIIHHISDQLNVLGLFYAANPTMISNKLVNVGTRGQDATEAWNAHLWDLK